MITKTIRRQHLYHPLIHLWAVDLGGQVGSSFLAAITPTVISELLILKIPRLIKPYYACAKDSKTTHSNFTGLTEVHLPNKAIVVLGISFTYLGKDNEEERDNHSIVSMNKYNS